MSEKVDSFHGNISYIHGGRPTDTLDDNNQIESSSKNEERRQRSIKLSGAIFGATCTTLLAGSAIVAVHEEFAYLGLAAATLAGGIAVDAFKKFRE